MKTWTDQEISTLKKCYGVIPNIELFKLIPGKTPNAICKKARKIGLHMSKGTEWLNRSLVRRRENGANWKGGKRRTSKGYVQVLQPENHRADTNGYVMEHIYVWEQKTGLPVPDNCVIHHLNGVKDDNRIENLCMMERGAHTIMHHTGTHLSEEARKKISDSRRKHA